MVWYGMVVVWYGMVVVLISGRSPGTSGATYTYNRRLTKCCARVILIFSKPKGAGGSTESKQWRIELLYQYKRAKTRRITVVNIQKPYLYFIYFKLLVYFIYFKLYLYLL